MSYTLVFHPNVESDVDEAYNWYEDKEVGLGERFLGELVDCYKQLEKHPQHYSRVSKNYRRILLQHFPYIIAYEILKDDVIVYAVFHSSRDHQEISRRKRTI